MSSLDEIISQYDPDVSIPGDKILPYVSTVYVINDTLYTVTNTGQVTNLGRYSGLPGRFIDNASILPNGRLALDIFGVGEWVSPTSIVGMRNIQMTNKGLGLFTGVTDTELNHKTVAWDSTFKVVNAPTDFKVSLAGDGGYDTELLHPDRYAEFNLGVGGVGLVHNPLGLDFTTNEVILTAGVYHIELNYSLVSEATLVLGLGLANSITPLQRIFANADASASGKLVEIITVDTPTVIRLINYSPKPTLHVSSQYATLRIHHLKPTTVGTEPSHNSYNAFSFKVKNNRLVNAGSYPVLLNFNQNATSFVDGGFLLSGASIGSFNFGVSIGSGEFNLSFTYTHKAAKGSTIQTVLTDAVTAANFSLEHDNTKEHLQLFLNGTLAEINTTHIKTNQPTHVNFVRNAQGILKTYVEGCLAGVYRYNATIPTNAFNLGGLGASGKVQAQINDLTLMLNDRWLTRNVNPINQSKYALPAPLATLVENQSNFRGTPTGLVQTFKRVSPDPEPLDIDYSNSHGVPVTVATNTYGLGYTGTNKYGNPALATNNRIYVPPFGAKDILVIDPITGTATRQTFGQTFPAAFSYISAVATPDGKVYFAPDGADHVLVIDTVTNTAVKKTYGLTFTASFKMSQGVYHGPTNRIYFPPMAEGRVLVIDCAADTATLTNFGLNLTGVSFGCSVVGKDNKVYCLPKNATNLLVIDPAANSAVLTNLGTTIPSTDNKFFGCVRVNNKIFALPFANGFNSMAIIDTDTQTLQLVALTGLPAANKWTGGFLNSDGNIYFPPYGGGQVGVVNALTNQFSMTTLSASWPNNGYWGGAADSNGNYHMAPSDATIGVRSFVADITATKFVDLVPAANRFVYAIPSYFRTFIRIDTQLNRATINAYGRTFSGPNRFGGAIELGNLLYVIPDQHTELLIINVTTDTLVQALTTTGYGKPIYDAKRNLIYAPPVNGSNFLILNPTTRTISVSNFGLAGISGGYRSIVNLTDDLYYAVPMQATQGILIDLQTQTASFSSLGATLPAGAHRFNKTVLGADNRWYAAPLQNTTHEWLGINRELPIGFNTVFGLSTAKGFTITNAFTGPDGYTYFGISDGTFYRLNTETHEVTETNLGLPADSSSGGASCIGPDNKLYVAPHLGSNGFRVHTFNPA